MAADQALLASVSAGGPAVLRFYRWHQPTLSLGYFQPVSQRSEHPDSQALPRVRRSTGGGAIVHDQELTYSLTLPIVDRARRSVQRVYDAVHRAIRAVLADEGIVLQRFADSAAARVRRDAMPTIEPFLCFQRRTDEDLILAGYKVVGSAQRRSARAVLQHGSLLLRASAAAPQLPGINDLAARPVSWASLTERLPERLGQQLAAAGKPRIRWEASEWQAAERTSAGQIEAERFAEPSWNDRRV